MQRPPVRGFDTELAQDPLIYRLVEVGFDHLSFSIISNPPLHRTPALVCDQSIHTHHACCRLLPCRWRRGRCLLLLSPLLLLPVNTSHLQPPCHLRTQAVNHYGESLRALINEQHGDGIMSAIDFFVTADK